MTFEETRSILKIVKAEYPQSFRGITREDAEAKLNLWAEMFADDDVGLVGAAVKQIIVAGNREFAPNVGQIKEQMAKLIEKHGGYAWQAAVNTGKCKDGAFELGGISRIARERGLPWHEAKQLALAGVVTRLGIAGR